MSGIEPEVRLFADDCVYYHEIKDMKDTLKLQKDIDRVRRILIEPGNVL